MARKKEGAYQYSVSKIVQAAGVYYQSMAGTQTNGTPDAYYSGSSFDLWVEYKYFEKIPKQFVLYDKNKKSNILSKLQFLWLTERDAQGRNVVVILGSPQGGCFVEVPDFERTLQLNHITLLPKSEIADLIVWSVDIKDYHRE